MANEKPAQNGISHKSVPEKTKELKIKWLNGECETELKDYSIEPVKTEQIESSKLISSNGTSVVRNGHADVKSALSRLEKRPPITIDFTDVCYSVRANIVHRSEGKKEILKGVSGSFKTGELTAVMGSSGAGKSCLINAVAGYVTNGVTGSIRTNGRPRQIRILHKLSAYIMQDDLLQPQLSVEELMTIAANLKVGNELSKEQRKQVVDEILNTLGLTPCRTTRTEKLSGGQRKRLSVAVELVNNPPVIFLDEPTTGLDIVSMNQLMSLLQNLAKQGRTIICSIHQPTATIFEQFDHVYVMAKGLCVYQGSPDQLVPFLAKSGFQCPITYNPADYIIELLHDDADDCLSHLSNEIQNGKISYESPKSLSPETIAKLTGENDIPVMPQLYTDTENIKLNTDFPNNFFVQFWILLKRMLTQQIRNRVSIWLLIVYHLLVGGLLGILYMGVGNDASRILDNFKFMLSVVIVFMYTHIMGPVLIFPAETKLLKREYFNHWYGLKSYFLALTVSTIPRHVIFGTVVCVLCYLITDQPMDISRFLFFEATGLLVGFISEGYGVTIGSICSPTNGSVAAPAILLPWLVVAVYGIGFGDNIEPHMSFLMSLSFMRYAMVSICTALLGLERPALYCDFEKETICPFQNSEFLLKKVGMSGVSMTNQLLVLVFFVFLFRISAFLALRFRLTTEFSNPILKAMARALKKR